MRCEWSPELSETASQPGATREVGEANRSLFDLSQIDLRSTFADGDAVERVIPHRGAMRLLDRVIWLADDYRHAVGIREVREGEFWIPGHFPQKPLFPGVLMVESGAQLAAYVWNKQKPEPTVAAFLRIDRCVFRRSVVPGEDLLLLCREIKQGKRRFITELQGMVGDEVAFEAEITGMALGPMQA